MEKRVIDCSACAGPECRDCSVCIKNVLLGHVNEFGNEKGSERNKYAKVVVMRDVREYLDTVPSVVLDAEEEGEELVRAYMFKWIGEVYKYYNMEVNKVVRGELVVSPLWKMYVLEFCEEVSRLYKRVFENGETGLGCVIKVLEEQREECDDCTDCMSPVCVMRSVMEAYKRAGYAVENDPQLMILRNTLEALEKYENE